MLCRHYAKTEGRKYYVQLEIKWYITDVQASKNNKGLILIIRSLFHVFETV